MQAGAAHRKLAARLAADAYPLDYATAMRVIRDALAAVTPAPVVVAEGANTMDNARCARLPCSAQAHATVSCRKPVFARQVVTWRRGGLRLNKPIRTLVVDTWSKPQDYPCFYHNPATPKTDMCSGAGGRIMLGPVGEGRLRLDAATCMAPWSQILGPNPKYSATQKP